jgi:cytochrome c oxidase subunit II
MKWKQLLNFTAAALTIVLMLIACGNTNTSTNNASGTASNTASITASNTASNPASPAGGGQTKEITVTAKNFAFDPPAINLNVGDTVKITLKNLNGAHGFEIPDLKINLKNGETATFTVNTAGTFDYNCSIQCGAGHDNMTGTITVS